jgi:prepilin-type N-terminal cleavage/methylation domain-containing protein
MRQRNNKQSGFSLTELMVSLVAGLLVSTAVIAFAFTSMRSNGEYVQSTRLTQELRNTLDLVTRELRRAGYDEHALQYLASGDASPFSRIEVASANTTPSGTFNCVIYSYDRTGGIAGTRDGARGEIRGIRWKSRTVNGSPVGVIEFAESKGTNQVTCDGATPDYSKYPVACNASSYWCALSDPRRLNVSTFAITDNRSVIGDVQVRDLDVSIIGGIAGSDAISREVRSKIRVRSDCFDATIANCSTNPSP